MIVVDTNLIAYLLLAGEHTDQTRDLFRKDPHWVAPMLWRSEFRSVLTRYMRQAGMRLEEALRVCQDAETLMSGGEYQVTTDRTLSLVSVSTCSAYDCEFVALAVDLGVPLLTRDRQILSDFPSVVRSPDNFLS